VKRRKTASEIEATALIGEVEGKNVIIVDDLTETAGTLTGAARILRANGAREIYAGVSHAVLTDLAVERLKSSDIKQLITTDSVPIREIADGKVQVVSIAELLGEGIRRIHDDESVSSLFELKNV
jgi:ribose-phosphate pyrophosphokinase